MSTIIQYMIFSMVQNWFYNSAVSLGLETILKKMLFKIHMTILLAIFYDIIFINTLKDSIKPTYKVKYSLRKYNFALL